MADLAPGAYGSEFGMSQRQYDDWMSSNQGKAPSDTEGPEAYMTRIRQESKPLVTNVDPSKTAGVTFASQLDSAQKEGYLNYKENYAHNITEYEYRQKFGLDTSTLAGTYAPVEWGTFGHSVTTVAQNKTLASMPKVQETQKATVIPSATKPTSSGAIVTGNSALAKYNKAIQAQAVKTGASTTVNANGVVSVSKQPVATGSASDKVPYGYTEIKDPATGQWKFIPKVEKVGSGDQYSGTATLITKSAYLPTDAEVKKVNVATTAYVDKKTADAKAESAAFQSARSQSSPLFTKGGVAINEITDSNGNAIANAHNEQGQTVTISTPINESLASKARTAAVYQKLVASGKTSAGEATITQTDNNGNAVKYYTRGSDATSLDQSQANQRRISVVQTPQPVVPLTDRIISGIKSEASTLIDTGVKDVTNLLNSSATGQKVTQASFVDADKIAKIGSALVSKSGDLYNSASNFLGNAEHNAVNTANPEIAKALNYVGDVLIKSSGSTDAPAVTMATK